MRLGLLSESHIRSRFHHLFWKSVFVPSACQRSRFRQARYARRICRFRRNGRRSLTPWVEGGIDDRVRGTYLFHLRAEPLSLPECALSNPGFLFCCNHLHKTRFIRYFRNQGNLLAECRRNRWGGICLFSNVSGSQTILKTSVIWFPFFQQVGSHRQHQSRRYKNGGVHIGDIIPNPENHQNHSDADKIR